MNSKVLNTKTKYRAMNWARTLAFFFIIVYHFMVQLEQGSNYDFASKGLFYYSNANLHIAIIGVSMFFMISGAGLMLSATRRWDVKDFYKRRFVKLLIPFYLVELFTLVASFAIKPEWLASFPFISKGKIILNLLGMDGYFEQFFPTFSLHVGEWFLGALIMLYALFPLFRFCMVKNRYLTIIVATAYYLVFVLGNYSTISPWTNVFVKAYDFVLGMFLIIEIPKFMENLIFRRIARIISALIIILGSLFNFTISVPVTIKNLIYAISIFVFFFSVEEVGNKDSHFDKLIEWVCQISYEVFLVHHIIIYYIGDNLTGRAMALRQIAALFVVEIFVMISMALAVRSIMTNINRHMKKNT